MTTIITEARATGKYLRLSPHKTRRILNQIRGKKYQEAILILEFMPYKPCKIIKKILESAGNNAINRKWDKNNLIITRAFVNEGPKLKRFQPRAQGKAFSIHKPTCHITINVANK
uniref:Large ribosomal subunit protein uL22c n=2 Tax=Gracilariopsis TaxID=2781 RepID=A0A1C9CFA8_9FLOR|nr:ribosomal protein L22 [Gracilariopsis lemaneiformis]YP_009294795.1 ribosomal protein L22 [Gracilariopsis chorda]AJO68436.1 ribosomal protein L22 [Gracilariopsis lemaneiformis]AML79887.1 ribosomal protein L22 [Gracilariopsis lemaneiformis]AOM67055.1 ribosomal protein L22 [Gracilariopsis chorda]